MKNEKGVALLSVLLLVAVLSALAVAVLDDIRFDLRRSANAESTGQAQWYALGAESLARARIARLSDANANRTSLEGDWNGRWQDFPIENGGIHARVSDATGCFNLNSVVQGASEQWQRRDIGLRQFSALLRGIGFSQRDSASLAETLADWIDSDNTRNTLGAEDDAYMGVVPSYRTSGTLLSEVSELRAVRGFTSSSYARLRPFVCALPTAELSPININTLTPDNAVLLSALTEGALPVETARRVLAARPREGWASVDDFWQEPALANAVPSDAALNQVAVRTRYFRLHAEITYAGADAFLTTLFEQAGSGPARLAARRWGRDE
jgi:general secretion pathway protein K